MLCYLHRQPLLQFCMAGDDFAAILAAHAAAAAAAARDVPPSSSVYVQRSVITDTQPALLQHTLVWFFVTPLT